MKKIELATENDRDQILELYQKQKGEEYCPWDEDYPSDETISFDLSRDSLFVMKDNDKVIAAISIELDETVDNLDCWNKSLFPGGELARVAVDPPMQGRGIGRQMMEYGIGILKERGYKSIHFLVNKYNIKAIKCYASFGFNVVGECFMYDQDFLCYEKALKMEEMEQKIILETDRLFLREMNMDDFDALYKVLADKDIMQHYPYIFDEKRVRDWIERNMNRYCENGFGLWAVCLKDTGEMIGDCGLTLQNIEGEILPEIGYHIRADHQHKGYAKEAAAAVRDWAFSNTDYPSLYSYCKYTNIGSYKTAESIGMHFEKEYPDDANEITHVSVIHRPAIR